MENKELTLEIFNNTLYEDYADEVAKELARLMKLNLDANKIEVTHNPKTGITNFKVYKTYNITI